jgi:UDP-N-acetyl-D-mannosaminuronate dehydrogenase
LNDDIEAYVDPHLVKAMFNRRTQADGARVLIMGLTFNETCHVLRNTRPADV